MEYKLFVGNIPFDCKKKDFKKCFQNFDGFVSADLINSNSKSFGFVVFNKKITVDNIIKNNNIIYIHIRRQNSNNLHKNIPIFFNENY